MYIYISIVESYIRLYIVADCADDFTGKACLVLNNKDWWISKLYIFE